MEQEHVYLNRKGYHSKNVQIICDSNLEILHVNANYGGSAHDSFIWRQSSAYIHMRNRYVAGDRNTWLLGDSGYPQQPWLMTRFRDPAEDSPEARYNNSHIQARNCVERCIGVLKGRFRCLLKERMLRYSPHNSGLITNACCILHNICVKNGVVLDDDIPDLNNDGDYNIEDRGEENEGRQARDHLVRLYFNED